MNLRWTFGQKIAAGFAAVVALTIICSLVGVRALHAVVTDKDRVITENAGELVTAAKFQAAVEWKVGSVRGYLLTGANEHLQRLNGNAPQAQLTARLLQSLSDGGLAMKGSRNTQLRAASAPAALASLKALAPVASAAHQDAAVLEELVANAVTGSSKAAARPASNVKGKGNAAERARQQAAQRRQGPDSRRPGRSGPA